MSITPKYRAHKEAREDGWFSRRHSTSMEHLEAQRVRREKQAKKDAREKGAPK